MIILHIANVNSNQFAGVNVAVPEQIRAQAQLAEVGIINLSNIHLSGIPNQFKYTDGIRLESLPAPFSTPDMIVFHEIYYLPFLSISRQALNKKIPYVIVPHGGLTVSAQRKKAYKKIPANLLLFGQFIRGAAAVQCLSDREMEQTKFRIEKFIGTNGITLRGKKNGFSDTGLQFTYIGRLDYHIKGLDLLVEAVRQDRHFLLKNQCHVDLYGPDEAGALKKLRDLQEKYKLEEIMTVHPPVSGDEKDWVLMNSDYYIQTSRTEGMSMGILEAMGWGIPCIVTQGTGMADLVKEKGAGWGCETDAVAIAATIKQAVQERSALPVLSMNARLLIEERFTWQQIARDTIAHYQTIICERD